MGCNAGCEVVGWRGWGWYAVGWAAVGLVDNEVWWGGAEWSGGWVWGFMVGPCGWGRVNWVGDGVVLGRGG